MAIKLIKFDLPINGTKVTTLDVLRDNLTDEIVKLARSGQLERWFKSRQLQEQAQAVAAAVSQHTEDKALFLALCAVLEVEVHPDDASAIFDAPPEAGLHLKNIQYFRHYEELRIAYQKLEKSLNQQKNEENATKTVSLGDLLRAALEKTHGQAMGSYSEPSQDIKSINTLKSDFSKIWIEK